MNSKESVWSKKPWWCQPWSIALTGISLLSGLYFVFGLNWPLFVLGAPIVVWMVFFLGVYPNAAK
jgi:membrane protein YdbS with pleckstrin-like domain